MSRPVSFPFDVAAAYVRLTAGELTPPELDPTTYEFRSRRGFSLHLDNHETGAHYVAESTPLTPDDLASAAPASLDLASETS